MASSILILCIVSILLFDPIASEFISEKLFHSKLLSDFGFSRLIDKLIMAQNRTSNQKVMFKIFAKVRKEMKIARKISGPISKIDPTDQTLRVYIQSANDIGLLYKRFERLLEEAALRENPNASLKKLIRQCTSSTSDGLPALSYNFRYKDVINNENFMDSLIQSMKIEEEIDSCWYSKQSSQYKIFSLYHQLAIINTQAHVLRIYAYNIMRRHAVGNHKYGANERNIYKRTLRNFRKSATSAILRGSREIRSCNNAVNRKGNKYIELEQLFNPIVINEVYLNEGGSCWNKCGDYQNTTFHQHDDRQPDVNQCSGRIYDCFQETRDPCVAPDTSNRLRDFHGSHQDSTARDKKKLDWCSRKNRNPLINHGLFTVCDKCICYCDDHNHSGVVRKFSLRAATSDTSANKVITGIQFVEKNGTIYLRIQEGKLGPNGTIKKSTVAWQAIDDIIYKSPSPEQFFTVSYDAKYVNLDTLVTSTGQVLTGIRLYAQGSHLALEIRSHAFSFSTGILQNSHWQSFSPTIRKEITITDPDNPLYMAQSVSDRRRNTYVAFRKTSYEKDAAQTTVPLIDARPVTSHPPVPFSGAGIYYSGQSGSGGFIGLKAITYDVREVIGH